MTAGETTPCRSCHRPFVPVEGKPDWHDTYCTPCLDAAYKVMGTVAKEKIESMRRPPTQEAPVTPPAIVAAVVAEPMPRGVTVIQAPPQQDWEALPTVDAKVMDLIRAPDLPYPIRDQMSLAAITLLAMVIALALAFFAPIPMTYRLVLATISIASAITCGVLLARDRSTQDEDEAHLGEWNRQWTEHFESGMTAIGSGHQTERDSAWLQSFESNLRIIQARERIKHGRRKHRQW